MAKKTAENLPDENSISPLRQITDEADKLDTSFMEEVKALTAGLGWGVRWLGLSLAWGLCLFGFIGLVGYAIWGGPIDNPGAYYGLVVVVGLLSAGLSALRRQFS